MLSDERSIGFLQARRTSTATRPMAVTDALIYNFLTMGVIFPWVYVLGPAAFPGGSIPVAIWIALAAQLPISVAYAFLGTVLPVLGGDYVYQTRAFGRIGFMVVFSGFVVWIMQWVALSGWLLCVLGIAPLLMVIGVETGHRSIALMGLWVQTPLVVCVVSIGLAGVTTVLLAQGLRAYVRIQGLLFLATICAVGAIIFVFVSIPGTEVESRIATFFAALVHLTREELVSRGIVISDLAAANVLKFMVNPGGAVPGGVAMPPFSWLATLGLVPMVWTSLQWATYSAEQNTEIDEADRFGKQLWMLLVPAVALTICLSMIALVERRAIEPRTLLALSMAYAPAPVATVSAEAGFIAKSLLQPFPNVLAMFASHSVMVSLVIAVGFIANAFQITCNSFIGVTRILVAMALDGTIPSGWRLGAVDDQRHAPVRAHYVYCLATIPWIVAFNFVPAFQSYALGVTVACGYVFALSALAAAMIPTRMKSVLSGSELRGVPAKAFRITGVVGCGTALAMVGAYLVQPKLGTVTAEAYLMIAVAFAVAAVVLWSSGKLTASHRRSLAPVPEEVRRLY